MKKLTESVFTEVALPESFLFQRFNSSSQLTQRIKKAISTGVKIERSMIAEQILQIEKTRISTLVEPVLKAFDDGDIVLIYSPDIKIPQAIPFMVTKAENKIRGFVFVSNYGTMSKSKDQETYLNITMKDLYSLMECTYIAIAYAKAPQQISKKLGLMKTSTELYTSMLMNLLNGQRALSMDPAAYDKVSFCVAKFFLERVWMSDNDDINFSYAKSANPSSRGANVLELTVLNDEYQSANIKNISDLISFLGKVTPRIGDMNITYFMDSFIRMYKGASVLGLEVLPYFFFIINSSLIGSFIVRADIVTDIAKRTRGMNKFYPELVRAVS